MTTHQQPKTLRKLKNGGLVILFVCITERNANTNLSKDNISSSNPPLYIKYGVSLRGKRHQSGGMRVNPNPPFRRKACNVDLIPSSFLHRDRTVSEASHVRNRDELALTRMIQSTSLTDATYSVTT